MPLTPYDVSRGADTKVRIKVVTLGAPNALQKGRWDWNDAFTVRSLATARTIHDDVGRLSGEQILLGGNGTGTGDAPAADEYFVMTQALRLRDVPANRGELELRWDWVFGTQPIIPSQQYPSLEEITNLAKKVPGALSTRATMKVRGEDKKIKKPVVSTDPLFDVRGIKVTPSVSALRTRGAKVVLDVLYRGTRNPAYLYTEGQWEVRAGKENLTRVGEGNVPFKVTGSKQRGQLEYDLNANASLLLDKMKKQPLTLRGTISLDGAWPRIIEISIP